MPVNFHIAITVLALLLERTIEHSCQDIWRNIQGDLKRVQLVVQPQRTRLAGDRAFAICG